MDTEDVRVATYRWFARTGQAPTDGELAALLATDVGAVRRSLTDLAHRRHLVLDDAGRVVMAHPFSAVPLGFAVMGARTLWWDGCAWDSFALPHILPGEGDMLVSTRCPACSRAHAWNVGTRRPPAGDQVAHFLIPVARMWDDVVHTCRHQRLFCSAHCVTAWCRETGSEPGYVMVCLPKMSSALVRRPVGIRGGHRRGDRGGGHGVARLGLVR